MSDAGKCREKSGKSLENVWKMSGKYLENVWKMSDAWQGPPMHSINVDIYFPHTHTQTYIASTRRKISNAWRGPPMRSINIDIYIETHCSD